MSKTPDLKLCLYMYLEAFLQYSDKEYYKEGSEE